MGRIERDGNIATLWIVAPPLNILTLSVIEELDEQVARLEADPGVDFLLLRGAGERAFSAGVSVQDHIPPRLAPTLRSFHSLILRLSASRLISVAWVHGMALGGGLELALACDFSVIEGAAQVAQPEIDLGCFPPVAVLLLPALVGEKRAMDLLLLGRRLTGVEAVGWGLFARQIEADALSDFMGQLQSRSPAVMRQARRWIRRDSLRRLREVEQAYLDDLVPLADCREGLEAFVEKRKPIWQVR